MARNIEVDDPCGRYIGPPAGPDGIQMALDLGACEKLWAIGDVSAFLGVPIATLHRWRYLGTGPDAFRVGRHLRYDPGVVRRWLVSECAQKAG